MPAVQIGAVQLGGGAPLALIAGPCVIESEAHAIEVGLEVRDIAARAGVPYIYKASFDKANRTSRTSFRGPGLDAGLRILAEVRARTGVPVLTDIHEPGQAAPLDLPDLRPRDRLGVPLPLGRELDLGLGLAEDLPHPPRAVGPRSWRWFLRAPARSSPRSPLPLNNLRARRNSQPHRPRAR